jgi:class 3 adenylate cyclase
LERQVRFCTTSDGVRIAYAVSGAGPPLVRVLGWVTHLEFEQTLPHWSDFPIWGHAFAKNHLLVTYDGRGFGLSDRRVTDFSVERKVLDLEAVVDAAGLEKFALLAISEGGSTAVQYALAHPERVTHLIFYGSFIRPILRTEDDIDTVLNLIRQGWGSPLPAHRQFFTSTFMPDAGPELGRWFNELQRVSASPETVYRAMYQMMHTDLSDLLPKVTTPTLVIHRRDDATIPFSRGRHIAMSIPGAQFLALDGRNHLILPHEPEVRMVRKAIDEFLGAEPVIDELPGQEAHTASPSASTVLRTVMFADVVESTSLTERLGDEAFRARSRQLDGRLRQTIRALGGRAVEGKLLGDGVLAVFTSARDAVECALRCHREAAEVGLQLHIGLHAGDVLEEADNVYGGVVNIAARVAGLSEGGTVLVSEVVRHLVRTSSDAIFVDKGEHSLRGINEPLRLFEASSR